MILNLTQHPATADQITAGVVDVADRARLCALLTFDDLPTADEVQRRANGIAGLVIGQCPETTYDSGVVSAMIGGAPYLMAPLEASLRAIGVTPLYAFSVRESVETTQPDGTVKKSAIFKHAGFVDTTSDTPRLGRPPAAIPTTRYSVHLDDSSAETLRGIGAGNLSKGIRSIAAVVKPSAS